MQADEPGYVCSLVTERVRAIENVKRENPEPDEPEKYDVCVEATPLPDNDAHADIYTHPPAPNNSARRTVFRMLKEQLAEISTWEPGFGPLDEEEPPADA